MNYDIDCVDVYRIVKNFGGESSLVNKDCRKFGGKNFSKLKSICIGNVMEIVKTGEKIWQITVIHQICQSIFTANVFYCIQYMN